MAEESKGIKGFFQQNDLMFSVFFVGILVVMILPLPSVILDVLLTIIALSIVILMVAIHSEDPLNFSTFPSVLLIVTLFRLALNVGTTRTILLHGSDGKEPQGRLSGLSDNLLSAVIMSWVSSYS